MSMYGDNRKPITITTDDWRVEMARRQTQRKRKEGFKDLLALIALGFVALSALALVVGIGVAVWAASKGPSEPELRNAGYVDCENWRGSLGISKDARCFYEGDLIKYFDTPYGAANKEAYEYAERLAD
jgi:hypothetical protein